MEYFESNINVIRSQIKANKTYKEISNLFMQRFPEVRRGFSERNLRLFCSKHGISKLNEAEIDAVIQECVSEVRLPAFHLSFDFVLLYITLFETNSPQISGWTNLWAKNDDGLCS